MLPFTTKKLFSINNHPINFYSSQTVFTIITILTILPAIVSGQCPWSNTTYTDLYPSCVCSYSNVQKLSIQCSPVNFTRLLEALHSSVNKSTPVYDLYVNNATTNGSLVKGTFSGLDITNLHISKSRLAIIEPEAFSGLEDKLVKLSLPDNILSEIPIKSLSTLTALRTLDLSVNNITSIPPSAFISNQLVTLKLADNRLDTIDQFAFQGLEPHLKHLNLKGTSVKVIPTAIDNLTALAFLDLAQNRLTSLPPRQFANLQTLTALSLERNKIKTIDDEAFLGVNDSLSSLSLLNNQIKTFPSQAISSLTELRVLDLGFNIIESIPEDAFHKNTLLTLLALDGNPMSTLSLQPFKHLNSTLRGLSLGGKSLICDCQLRWVVQWVRKYDLQVSSRERYPQFCGEPSKLKNRNFLQLTESDLNCANETTQNDSQSTTSSPAPLSSSSPSIEVSTVSLPLSSSTQATTTTTTNSVNIITSSSSLVNVNSSLSKSSRRLPVDWSPDTDLDDSANYVSSSGVDSNNLLSPSSVSSIASNSLSVKQQAPSSSSLNPSPPNETEIPDIRLLAAYRWESSIVLEWETLLEDYTNGFQILYRFFGSKEYKKGAKLGKSARRYVLPHVPSGECIIVCVVPAEVYRSHGVHEIPSSLCQEIRRDRTKIADLDKLVIGATAAICALVVIAVILFTCCYGKDKKKSLPSLPPPLAGPMKPDNEWETVSMYSARSIPRARMYHLDGTSASAVHHHPLNGSLHNIPLHDDNRSHISNYSLVPNGYGGNKGGGVVAGPRPTGDGQSHRSYSTASAVGRFGNASLPHNELSKSSLSVHPEYDSDQWVNGPMMAKMTNGNAPHHHPANGWKDNQVDVYVGKNQLLANPMNGKYR
ncbi:slit homolog 2 protein-like isoform X2 [Panonychus citri]|uniref:slit homolog 2 protein-like isoform X2 n=1 Tax=Panonychus citri TaxID=50023 RepID=UPI002307F327|nr:slit homolog 2 protein-like isoform X2 [Panonychus citri]